MTAHAFVNPPEDAPSEWTCSACSSVISAPEHVMAGEHVGCGGKVELRAIPVSRVPSGVRSTEEPETTRPENAEVFDELRALSAKNAEAADIDALLDEAGVPADPLAVVNAAAFDGDPFVVEMHAAGADGIGLSISTEAFAGVPTAPQPRRRRMPTTRHSRMRTFRLVQPTETFEFEFIAGFFEDGAVGEVFIHADRQGMALSGFLDATGIMISMLLQYGVPLEKIIGKLKGMRFPPDGRVPLGEKGETTFVTSPLDLLARWLETLLPASQTPCP